VYELCVGHQPTVGADLSASTLLWQFAVKEIKVDALPRANETSNEENDKAYHN